MRRLRFGAAWAGGLATLTLAGGFAALAGCGGSGGGGGNSSPDPSTTDPADEPVCASLSREERASSQGRLGGAGILVPATSVEKPADVGVTAHTDHLIYLAGGSRGDTPTGLSPAQVRTAYSIPSGAGSGAIAIVVAYHAPTILNDFNVFSAQFGLPQEGSATATASTNAKFQVVYASGTKPSTDAGWAQEASLDTQWAHAMAPGAKIYLVEAASARVSDLMAAATVAKGLPGVRQISMSFGATENACLFAQYDPVFRGSSVAFFAPSGDSANERDFPALSRDVVAVGGTKLSVNALGVRRSETAWEDGGAGRSRYSPRPPFQDGLFDQVGRYRSACDIAAVADPATGVSVYDSTPSDGESGWFVFGGTSASTPIIAGIANGARTTGIGSRALAARLYLRLGTSDFHDITAGTAGSFTAAPGWDANTGVGTPNGPGAFQ